MQPWRWPTGGAHRTCGAWHCCSRLISDMGHRMAGLCGSGPFANARWCLWRLGGSKSTLDDSGRVFKAATAPTRQPASARFSHLSLQRCWWTRDARPLKRKGASGARQISARAVVALGLGLPLHTPTLALKRGATQRVGSRPFAPACQVQLGSIG